MKAGACLVFAALALLAAPLAAADFFRGGYYTPSSGKVGLALVSDASFDVGDMPPGCVVQWKNISVAGNLPPGISPPGADMTLVAPAKDENGIPYDKAEVPDIAASAFFGTPRQAGDWPVTVTFHSLSCSGGQDYGDRVIKLSFHISP